MGSFFAVAIFKKIYIVFEKHPFFNKKTKLAYNLLTLMYR